MNPTIWETALRVEGVVGTVALRHEPDEGDIIRATAGDYYVDILLDDVESVQSQPRVVQACAKAIAHRLKAAD